MIIAVIFSLIMSIIMGREIEFLRKRVDKLEKDAETPESKP